MRAKFKRILFPSVLVSLGIIVAIIVSEIALRLIGFEFALFPTKIQFGWPDPITLRHLYQVDRELLWVPKDYSTKIAAWQGKEPSVVFMGDSCTQFGRYDKFFEAMVGERHQGGNFSFVNVGVGGWSSYQGLQQLKRDVVPMQPRIITIYFGWNDHWTTFGIEDKDIGRFNLEQPDFLLLLSRLRVGQVINRAVFALKHRGGQKTAHPPKRVSLPDFRANLLHIIQISRSHDIIPVLLTAATSHQQGEEPSFLENRWLNDLSELVPLHQSYIRVVREISARERVPLIDLAAEFERLSRERLAKSFQKDGVHLTEEGDRRIAQLMYEGFMRLKLVDRMTSRK